jgi:diamine N-acetyltransferase
MIKGQKIYLRAMEPDDISRLYIWENDPEIWHVSNTYIPFSRHYLNRFIETSGNDLFADKQLRLMICSKDSNEAIGTLDFFEFDPMHRRAGVGILVAPEHRENGVAAEALQLAVDYVFEVLNLHQVFAHVTSDNFPSLHLFQKAGFEITGEKKHWLMIRNSWKNVVFLQLINQKNE